MFLSFVIPVYKAEKYLEECLRSCLNQNINEEDYEIICINDGSPDSCGLILNRYAQYHPNIVIMNQDNAGVSIARNNWIANAKGEYIWFVDADDLIVPNCLAEIKAACLERPDRLRLGSYYFFDEISENEIENITSNRVRPNTPIRNIYITRNLFLRSFLKENCLQFVQGIAHGEDVLFDYFANKCLSKDFEYNQIVYLYRRHPGSVMQLHSDKQVRVFVQSHLEGLKIVAKEYKKESLNHSHCTKTDIYLVSNTETVMKVLCRLNNDEIIVWLQELKKIKPVLMIWNHNIKHVLLFLYSHLLHTLCLVSTVFPNVLRMWRKVIDSKLIKKWLHH